LHELWGNKDNENEERWAEIFRLAFADQENPNRFREQFFKMIAVQFNEEANTAYKKELIQLRDKLSTEHIFDNLERYLEQGDWKEADKETAFIFYQLMVMQGCDYLLFLRLIPLDIINEIDNLWMNYSGKKFGIKGQAKIYQDLGGTEEINKEVWKSFCERVGWHQGGYLVDYREATFDATTKEFHLPRLMHQMWVGGGGVGGVFSLGFLDDGYLLWRLKE
jgi:hypothetical protein